METEDNMEDSGFDSDPKNLYNGVMGSPKKVVAEPWESTADSASFDGMAQNVPDVVVAGPGESSALKALQKSAELKKKLERQRDAARKPASNVVDHQPKSKGPLLSRSRLVVPTKQEAPLTSLDHQPLVMLETDDSEDEFLGPGLSKRAQHEISQQLIKDGYNLDLEPDDEDLDLIPPRPINERCICCNRQVNCLVQ